MPAHTLAARARSRTLGIVLFALVVVLVGWTAPCEGAAPAVSEDVLAPIGTPAPDAGAIASPRAADTISHSSGPSGVKLFEVFLLSVLWIVLFVLLLRAFVGALRERSRAELLGCAALVLGALLVRWLGATWGPGDTWMHLRTVLYGAWDRSYGSAPNLFFQPVFLVAPRSLETLMVVNLVIGGLVPLVAYAFVRAAAGSSLAGFVAGAATALHPMLIRFSAEGSRLPILCLLATIALWSIADFHATRRKGSLVRAYAAVMLATATRPEGLLILAMVGLYSVCHWRPRQPITRPLLVFYGATAATVGGYFVAYHLASTGTDNYLQFGYLRDGLLAGEWRFSFPWWDAELTPVAMTGLFVVTAAIVALRRTRFAVWALLSLALVAAAAVNKDVGNFALGDARYHLMGLFPFLAVLGVGGALGVEELRASSPRLRWIGGGLAAAGLATLAVWSAAPYEKLLQRLTIDHEYDFFRDAIPQLPEDAEFFVGFYSGAEITDDLGLKLPHELNTLAGRPGKRWWKWPDDLGRQTGPAFFYLQATCALDPLRPWGPDRPRQHILDIRERCEAAMARYGHRPVFERLLPARRYHRDFYDTDPVPVGIYAMDELPVPAAPAPGQ